MKKERKTAPMRSDADQGRTSNQQNLQHSSPSRGGTTDMGDEAIGRGRQPGRAAGSGLKSKTSVTGSDYDGQVA